VKFAETVKFEEEKHSDIKKILQQPESADSAVE